MHINVVIDWIAKDLKVKVLFSVFFNVAAFNSYTLMIDLVCHVHDFILPM